MHALSTTTKLQSTHPIVIVGCQTNATGKIVRFLVGRKYNDIGNVETPGFGCTDEIDQEFGLAKIAHLPTTTRTTKVVIENPRQRIILLIMSSARQKGFNSP